jgi:hypothetical protein
MAVRCVVTINTSNIDGESRRAECAAIGDLLRRVEQVLVATSGKAMVLSGSISDRNGNGSSATYVYTPTASA